MVVHIVGGCHDVKGCRGGILHRTAFHRTVGVDVQATFGSQSAVDAFLCHIVDCHGYLSILGLQLVLQRTLHVHTERQCARLAGSKPNDNGMVGKRGEDGLRVTHSLTDIRRCMHGITNVQFAAVVAHVVMT